MTDPLGWPPVPEAEMAAFHATADAFLDAANALVGEEPTERIAAAFFYAGTRFTAFAMQAQADDGAQVAPDVRDWLVTRLEEELRDHMAQQLRREAFTPVAAQQVPDAAIDELMALNDMDPEARRLFLRLADRFIHVANDMIETTDIPRISAALLHACTRFNAYVMQARGLAPGPLDDTIATDFRNAFRALLDFHLGQSVVADRDT